MQTWMTFNRYIFISKEMNHTSTFYTSISYIIASPNPKIVLNIIWDKQMYISKVKL